MNLNKIDASQSVELVNCEYYLTSEESFSDHLKFVNETPNNGTRFRFFSLATSAIKFELTVSKTAQDRKLKTARYNFYPTTDSVIDYLTERTNTDAKYNHYEFGKKNSAYFRII